MRKINKEEWSRFKLGELCSKLTDGSHNPAKGIEHSEFMMISSQNIHNDSLSLDDVRFLKEEDFLIENKRTEIKQGDILLTIVGSIGRCYVIKGNEGNLALQRSVAVMSVKEIVSPYYVRYYFIANQELLNRESHGVAQKGVYLKQLSEMNIPVPAPSTQSLIIHELDCICNIVETKKRQISDLDRLTQSLFFEMFGNPVQNEKNWPCKKLVELSEKITNGNTPKGGSQVYVDNGVMFLRSQNVWRNRMELDDVAYIDNATHAQMSGSSLRHNDILITKTGRINTENSSLGRAALYTGENNQANINGHVYLVRLGEGVVEHKFVLYILISEPYRELIRSVCVGGIDKRQLNRNHIEDFPIIVPPLDMQRKYVERIEKIEQQKKIISESLKDLEALLSKRMQYWFDS